MTKLTDQVYTTLRRQIMGGDLAPDEQVKEERIAKLLDVSRTPVRAAMNRLTRDGLLYREPSRGFFVSTWNTDDIKEVFDLRIQIESKAAGLAALRATPEQINNLLDLSIKMDELVRTKPEGYLKKIQEKNRKFHSTLMEASRSKRLAEIAKNLVEIPITIGFYIYSEEDMKRSMNHHRELVHAIKIGSENYASEVMTVHLRAALCTFIISRNKNESMHLRKSTLPVD
ncbi:GntR family transcriptional regulator [Halomonas citrativorans]|uniref:GntR family transcriptional regulator n=1 Tax=Halomonas citrativorans TaxID=2742612 RepID=UPI000B3514FC|nr:GntR family transcriptional regulator [Halomonas citrativorans]